MYVHYNLTCFLDLSAEIRNRIYDSALRELPVGRPPKNDWIAVADPNERYIGRFRFFRELPNSKFSKLQSMFSQPAISKTCRQIRQETLAMFYGANEFNIIEIYPKQCDDLRKPLLSFLAQWLTVIEQHVPLMNRLIIDTFGDLKPEMIVMMKRKGFAYEAGVFKGIKKDGYAA
ncbi:hypothetical protein LTR37_018091 [Vermiconidia calcicola]|uniref:Uncharacterized protein n=1 Tax=Vermiconidia calcicola TaxID=1690605 RepID=A0ACC3MI45_9PEZI|nr:hypothetical protein LTR37_018091 [Vermiconidia calcicola]